MAEHKIDIEKSAKNILDRVQQKLGISAEQLLELAQAYQEGRCVVLPFPLHRMLLDTSDPYNPELLKDFRISATWTHRGIVFHAPWDIFLQNIEEGYIRLMREEAEAMLKKELKEESEPK